MQQQQQQQQQWRCERLMCHRHQPQVL